VFVGCDDDECSTATRDVFDRSKPQFKQRVDAYAPMLVDMRIKAAPQPVFVLTAGGSPKREFTLVRPESKP
jgi:hypothetical protein